MSLPIAAVGPEKVEMNPIFTVLVCATAALVASANMAQADSSDVVTVAFMSLPPLNAAVIIVVVGSLGIVRMHYIAAAFGASTPPVGAFMRHTANGQDGKFQALPRSSRNRSSFCCTGR